MHLPVCVGDIKCFEAFTNLRCFVGNPSKAHQGVPRHQRGATEEGKNQGSSTKEERETGRNRGQGTNSSQDSSR